MGASHRYAYFGLAVGVIAVSTAAIFVKLSTAPASIIAAYRLIFTVLLLIPTAIYYRRDLKKLSFRDLRLSLLSGFFLAFHFIAWFESLNYTSVASSVVLVTLQPIFAMLGIYLIFKQKVSLLGILGAIVALSGSLVIGWGDFKIGGSALYGDLLALLGAVLVTGYWLVGQSLRQRLSLFSYTILVYGASSMVLIAYNLLLNTKLIGYPRNDWLIFLGLALIPTILGHTVFNWVIKYVNAATVSTVILAEPVGATILAYFLLGEGVNATQISGALLILTGIIIYLKFK